MDRSPPLPDFSHRSASGPARSTERHALEQLKTDKGLTEEQEQSLATATLEELRTEFPWDSASIAKQERIVQELRSGE